MTVLDSDSSLKRDIRIPGLDKPVSAEITGDGISFWIKGSRKRVTVTWRQIVLAGQTGTDVPSFLMNNPLGLLQYQITKGQKRET